jgi:hypothetical protein
MHRVGAGRTSRRSSHPPRLLAHATGAGATNRTPPLLVAANGRRLPCHSPSCPPPSTSSVRLPVSGPEEPEEDSGSYACGSGSPPS